MLDFKIMYNVVKLNNPRIFIKNFGPNWSQLKPIVILISSVIITMQLRILNFFATKGFVNCNLSKYHFRAKRPWLTMIDMGHELRKITFVKSFLWKCFHFKCRFRLFEPADIITCHEFIFDIFICTSVDKILPQIRNQQSLLNSGQM